VLSLAVNKGDQRRLNYNKTVLACQRSSNVHLPTVQSINDDDDDDHDDDK